MNFTLELGGVCGPPHFPNQLRPPTVRLAVLAFIVAIFAGAGAALGDSLSTQMVIAALERTALPTVVPDFVQYAHGDARPVSQSDRSRGVIAHYAVAINFRAADTTTGLTYRIFRDHHAAALYAKHLSVFEAPG